MDLLAELFAPAWSRENYSFLLLSPLSQSFGSMWVETVMHAEGGLVSFVFLGLVLLLLLLLFLFLGASWSFLYGFCTAGIFLGGDRCLGNVSLYSQGGRWLTWSRF